MSGTQSTEPSPSRPVMIYDGDCRFCELWIRRWQQTTGDSVEYVTFQDPQTAERFPELTREALEKAVHLVAADRRVFRGARAAFEALAVNPSCRWPLRAYEKFPRLAQASEWGYRLVAEHRGIFSFFTRLLWGRHVERPNYLLTRWVFLRGLAVIYLIAFASFWVQVEGLIGANGILPVNDLMRQAGALMESEDRGLSRIHLLPTLSWISSSDGMLHFQCAAGVVLALLLAVGTAPRLCLALLWMLYLSLVAVGREFMAFQWDNLLLEVGLLAVFLAPSQWLPGLTRERPPSRIARGLLLLVLFKLMFLSGVVKLMSGDPAWRDLTALTYHYETQPLPTWIGWHFHQLPIWFHKLSCFVMFVVELAVPFLIFMPRRPRMAAGLALICFQVLILLTGNYTFFNGLTILLCLVLFDDVTWRRLVPRKPGRFLPDETASAPTTPRRRWILALGLPAAVVLASISFYQMLAAFVRPPVALTPIGHIYRWVAPFRSVNSYGLFAVMTKDRPEIIIEGSRDGQTWRIYDFKHKPGNPKIRPGFVAPHQPRLDWQMWFAALGSYRQNPWTINLCVRLLQGSPEVLGLLEKNPFPDDPPKYIRARIYDYQFTSREERQQTGAWWKLEPRGDYLPVISLEMVNNAPAAATSEPERQPRSGRGLGG